MKNPENINIVTRWPQTPEDRRDKEAFTASCEFFEEYEEQLRKLNPDSFVAVYQDRVVAANTNFEKLREEAELKGVDLRYARVKFLAKKPTPKLI